MRISRLLLSGSGLALLGAILVSLGLLFPFVWHLVIPGLAVFFVSARQTPNILRAAAWRGILFGCVTGGAAIVWFFEVLPLDFLYIRNPLVQGAAVGLTWLYVSFSLGLPIGLAGAVLARLPLNILFPLWAGLIWTVAEIARMWSFSLLTWGPNSLLGPHFSAASVGYPLTENSSLLSLAHPFGLNALNFSAAFAAAFLAVMILRPETRRSLTLAAIAGACLFFGLPNLPALGNLTAKPKNSIRVAVISENISDVRDLGAHGAAAARIAEAAAHQPPVDVVVLPEEFGLTSIFWSREEAERFINKEFGGRDVLILNTRNRSFPAEEKNDAVDYKNLVFESTARGELGRYVKQMLMPLGEYRPALARLVFSLIPDADLQMFVESLEDSPARGGGLRAVEFHGVKIGALLCSDLLSPLLYRSLSEVEGAQVLINMANQFWFHGSRLLHSKTRQIARVHAVQNRKKILVADNMAPAFALDSDGRLLQEAHWGKSEVLYFDVP